MAQAPNQILFTGGHVLDIDGNVDIPEVNDILVEDGVIVEVGPNASMRAVAHADIHRIDARQKLIIPGLINAHYHSHDVMLRGLFEQLPLDAWMQHSGPASFSRPPRDRIELRTQIGAAECLLNGITTIQDMVSIVGADEDHLNGILDAYKRSGIRVVLALQISDKAPIDCVPFWREMPNATLPAIASPPDAAPLKHLIERSIKKSDDLLTWAVAPSAPQRCSDALLNWVKELSEKCGLQVFTHLYEARSQAVIARQLYPDGSLLAHLEELDLLTSKLTIAHGVWMSEAEIKRFGAAHASLVCNPMSNMKLLNGFAPIVQYSESGANIGLGCDNCSGNDTQNIFQSMKMFALFWGMYSCAGERGAALQAFKAATIGGARALGLDGKIGMLRPGFRADLVMIDLSTPQYSPMNSAIRQLVYSESGSGVELVMVGGRVVVANKKLVNMSSNELKERAEIWRTQLAQEVNSSRQNSGALLKDILAAYEKANQYPLDFDRFLMRKN
jgi:5-methylthioadenosine/S-adenosylhomocysteine deaminase